MNANEDPIVARALAEMKRVFSTPSAKPQRPAAMPAVLSAPRPQLPSESFEARLFSLLGRKVRTSDGAGILVKVWPRISPQCHEPGCAVVLDSEVDRLRHFLFREIEPVSWIVGDEDLTPKPAQRVLESPVELNRGEVKANLYTQTRERWEQQEADLRGCHYVDGKCTLHGSTNEIDKEDLSTLGRKP